MEIKVIDTATMQTREKAAYLESFHAITTKLFDKNGDEIVLFPMRHDVVCPKCGYREFEDCMFDGFCPGCHEHN